MFLAQLIGTLNIALPLVLGYQIAPEAMLSRPGIVVSAGVVGAYLYCINYRQSKNQQNVLLYKPSGETQKQLADEIIKCGMDPEDIALRYSYLNDSIASSNFNTICIDPMVWKGLEEGGDVEPVRDVIERHILPSVPEQNKQMQDHIKKNDYTGCTALYFSARTWAYLSFLLKKSFSLIICNCYTGYWCRYDYHLFAYIKVWRIPCSACRFGRGNDGRYRFGLLK